VPFIYTEITYYTDKIGFIKKLSKIRRVLNLGTDKKQPINVTWMLPP